MHDPLSRARGLSGWSLRDVALNLAVAASYVVVGHLSRAAAVEQRARIDAQKVQIADLSQQVQVLTEENTRLKGDNTRLASTASQVTSERDSVIAEQNTVYYVADTRSALAKRHIVENVGGFLGLGRTLVPAKNLDLTAFTPIDLRHVSEIALPRPGHRYRVITSQNLAALDTPSDKKGRLEGTLKIRDAQQFWAKSKFLIMVEQ